MDPFVEKQLIDVLRSMDSSLKGIKEELGDINLAIFEASDSDDEEEDDDSDDSEDSDEEEE